VPGCGRLIGVLIGPHRARSLAAWGLVRWMGAGCGGGRYCSDARRGCEKWLDTFDSPLEMGPCDSDPSPDNCTRDGIYV
jgi:hypothetical protein